MDFRLNNMLRWLLKEMRQLSVKYLSTTTGSHECNMPNQVYMHF